VERPAVERAAGRAALAKKGAGSGILDAGFARQKPNADGSTELGLGLPELRAYMDANFARATGHRRNVDRTLMIGEWPVLLKVIGKPGPGGRYLALQDVIDLFRKRSFSERMNQLRGGT